MMPFCLRSSPLVCSLWLCAHAFRNDHVFSFKPFLPFQQFLQGEKWWKKWHHQHAISGSGPVGRILVASLVSSHQPGMETSMQLLKCVSWESWRTELPATYLNTKIIFFYLPCAGNSSHSINSKRSSEV